MRLFVNGKPHDFDGDSDMPLLWRLREEARFRSVKFGCGTGRAGPARRMPTASPCAPA